MYRFVDTTESQEEQSLPSEALNFNGIYFEHVIPGYRTLYVSGREIIETEISDTDMEVRDGSRYRRKRYSPRTIVVGYQLITRSNEAFREAYNKLNALLDTEQAKLIFLDEPDKYFIGTKTGTGDVPAGRNAITSEIEFYCTDPFKYSVKEYEAAPSGADETTYEVSYNGTHPAYPVLEAVMKSDLGFVSYLTGESKILQIGDVEELDGELKDKSESLIEMEFSEYKESDWTQNNVTVADAKSMWNQAGRMGTGVIQGKIVLMPMSYDGGAGWHGPGISMVLPADSNGHSGAKNFTFEFRNYIEGDNIDMGDTEFVVTAKDVSGRRYHLAGIAFWKTQYGSPTGNVSVYSLGKQKKIFQTSFRNNANLYYTNHSITKFGDTLTFEVCGQKIEITDAQIKDLEAVEIGICLAQWSNYKSYVNVVDWLRFTSHSVEKWVDVPNKMAAGDVLTADCSTGEILLNGINHPELGALGNEWEDFCLVPGSNQIKCVHSDWGKTPKYRMRYREVFL